MKKMYVTTLALTASTIVALCVGQNAPGSSADDKDRNATRSSQNQQLQTDRSTTGSTTAGQNLGTHSTKAHKAIQAARTSELIGKDVYSSADDEIAEVKDVLVDLNHGRIAAIVVGSGGVLGVGERLTALPLSSFSFSPGGAFGTGVSSSSTDRYSTSDRDADHNRRDRNVSTGNTGASTSSSTSSDLSSSSSSSTASTASPTTAGTERSGVTSQRDWSQTGSMRGEPYASMKDRKLYVNYDKESLKSQQAFEWSWLRDETKMASIYRQSPDFDASRQPVRNPDVSGSTTTPNTTAMGAVHRASELSGKNIVDQANKTIGEVKDIVIDLNSGRVLYAVVSADMGETGGKKLYALPPRQLQASSATGSRHFTLNVSREQLTGAPSFEDTQWPNLNDPTWGSSVYRHYHDTFFWDDMGTSSRGLDTNRDLNRDLNRDPNRTPGTPDTGSPSRP